MSPDNGRLNFRLNLRLKESYTSVDGFKIFLKKTLSGNNFNRVTVLPAGPGIIEIDSQSRNDATSVPLSVFLSRIIQLLLIQLIEKAKKSNYMRINNSLFSDCVSNVLSSLFKLYKLLSTYSL